ncbi:PDDEXK-like family protein [Emticicia fontis]
MIQEQVISQILHEIITISTSYKRVDKANGGSFNIFSVLNIERDEVTTHSRFIAELLNPKGFHAQGSIFLQKFIAQVYGHESGINLVNLKSSNIKVEVEYFIGNVTDEEGGRLDIVVFEGGEARIMIENKIDAPEQPNQLQRYKNKFPDIPILFLTLDGKVSRYENFKEYKCISYKETIINWLTECRKEMVEVPILRETISQYINLLKKLTGQNSNTDMSLEIANRILKDEASFEAFIKLYQSKQEILKKVIKDRLTPLVKSLETDLKNTEIKLNYSEENMLKGGWSHAFFWFSSPEMTNMNINLCFSFDVQNGHQRFIFGFRYNDDIKKHNIPQETLTALLQERLKKGKVWFLYKFVEEYNNWEDLETLHKIYFDADSFKQTIKRIVNRMLNIVKSL